MLVVSNSPSLALGMVLAALAYFWNGFFNISSINAVQLRVPEDILVRVMGVFAISQSFRCAGWAVDGHYGEFDGHACGNDGWAYDHPSADRHDLCDATTSPKLARRSSPWRVTNFGFAYRLEFDGHDL
tara:strand:+ start:791 stop:1174 length:384 start_codon:yes stop_codon:yes gene_type:complete